MSHRMEQIIPDKILSVLFWVLVLCFKAVWFVGPRNQLSVSPEYGQWSILSCCHEMPQVCATCFAEMKCITSNCKGFPSMNVPVPHVLVFRLVLKWHHTECHKIKWFITTSPRSFREEYLQSQIKVDIPRQIINANSTGDNLYVHIFVKYAKNRFRDFSVGNFSNKNTDFLVYVTIVGIRSNLPSIQN